MTRERVQHSGQVEHVRGTGPQPGHVEGTETPAVVDNDVALRPFAEIRERLLANPEVLAAYEEMSSEVALPGTEPPSR